MQWKPDRYARLQALLRGAQVEKDVDEEFEHHLRLRVEAYIAAGMSATQARELALRRFGDIRQFQQQTLAIDHSILRERKRMELFDSVRRELKQAVRGLYRAPGFAIVAVLTLGLGIGATTAVYTMLDAVVLNPLPYPDSERLVTIDHPAPRLGPDVAWKVATASYFHYGERARSFEGYGAFFLNDANIRGRGDAFRGRSAQVTAGLLPLLGARPAVGRFFRPEEDVPNAPLVAVLSYQVWQREYAGALDVVGQTVEINGIPVEVIGVAPRNLQLPDEPVDVWYPRRISLSMEHRNWHHLEMLAKLRPGVSVEAAQAELFAVSSELPERFPTVYARRSDGSFTFRPRVRDLRETVVGNMSQILWIVLGSVGVVLIVGCANVANLFMVRRESRRNELAVRTALGAERAHLTVQSLAEGLTLTMTAAVLGIWFAYAGIRLLLAAAPPTLPRLAEVELGRSAVLFALIIGAVSGLVFGAFPLVRRRSDFSPLRESGRGLTSSRAQLQVRSVLVTAQIAFALVLLAAGGLMLRSYQHMSNVESGINADRVLTWQLSLPVSRYGTYEKAARYWQDLSQRLTALPAVLHVGASNTLPFANTYLGCATLWVDPPLERGVDGCIATMTLIPGFLETLGIRVRGRIPSWADVESQTGAIVITRSLGDRLWPGQDPLGKGIRGNGPGTFFYRVVGVADDFRAEGFLKPPSQLVLFPPAQIADGWLWGASTDMHVVIKSSTDDPAQLTAAVRRTIQQLDPAAAVGRVQPMKAIIAQSMVTTSFTMILLGLAGVMALVLSIVGLYGVVSYVVSRRRSEIGIRMALGANAAEVGGLVVMQSVRLGAIGVVIGLIGAFLTTHTLSRSNLLFEVEPTDPLTLTVVSFSLLGVAALASLIPARRAAGVSPAEALRAQ